MSSNIYILAPDFRYDVIMNNVKVIDGLRDARAFSGEQLLPSWQPPKVHKTRMDRHDADILNHRSNLPVLSQRAADVLSPLLAGHAELLPLDAGGETLFALNVLSVLAVLDEPNSTVERFSGGGKLDGIIKWIERFAFLENADGYPIFKLRGFAEIWVFVSQEFVDLARAARLKGACFRLASDPRNKVIEDH
jgi:hypothetical protein